MEPGDGVYRVDPSCILSGFVFDESLFFDLLTDLGSLPVLLDGLVRFDGEVLEEVEVTEI